VNAGLLGHQFVKEGAEEVLEDFSFFTVVFIIFSSASIDRLRPCKAHAFDVRNPLVIAKKERR